MKKKQFNLHPLVTEERSWTGVGSGSRSISQRYGSADPDPHQNVTDQNTADNKRSDFDLVMVTRKHGILTGKPFLQIYCLFMLSGIRLKFKCFVDW